MAVQLSIVEIDGKFYYQDDRLREYRQTTDFMNKIRFDEIGDREVKLVQARKELLPKNKNDKTKGRFI